MQEDFIPTHHFLPEDDYDQRLPLEQLKARQPLRHQIIFQTEQDDRKSKRRPLSAKVLRASFENATSKTSFPGLILDSIDNDIANIPGDDCMLLVAIWPGVSIIVLWDGRAYADVNLFTYQQEDFDKANSFYSHFRSGSALLTTLRDEQPRGVGRVVLVTSGGTRCRIALRMFLFLKHFSIQCRPLKFKHDISLQYVCVRGAARLTLFICMHSNTIRLCFSHSQIGSHRHEHIQKECMKTSR